MKLKALLPFLVCISLFASATIIESAARSRAATAMAEGAQKFLSALTPEQRARAVFSFESEERLDWHFVPRARKGIPFKELNDKQRKLAQDFLKTGLSRRGYVKATTIIELETVLRELEQGRGPARDPELYYFSIFGTPSAKNAWGWRVEGHHLSLNFTIVKGAMVATTPSFMGANPAEVRQGPRQGWRALGAEEDRARELFQSLDEKQRAQAIFDVNAPREIITMNAKKVDPLAPAGIPASEFNVPQIELLKKLLDEYLSRMPADLAAERWKKLWGADFKQIHFAWAGSSERNQPHYYRLQGPTFLIEYDNTQNNANHIHTVWRDFDGDFGEDLLLEHYKLVPHEEVTLPAVQVPGPIEEVGKNGVSKPVITYKEKAQYTEEARRKKIQGMVRLGAIFTADGRLVVEKVVRGLPAGLTQRAITAAQTTRFHPATKAGKPVNARAFMEFHFALY
jgi:TonB family protein